MDSPLPTPHDIALLRQIDEAMTLVTERMGSMADATDLDGSAADAVLWRLNVLSQSTERLPDEIRHRHGDVDWASLQMIGQVASGSLGGLTRDEVWQMTARVLPHLRVAVKHELGLPDAVGTNAPPERTRILLADDDPDIRHILDLLLTHAGFAVTEAADGQEALERAIEVRPDAVLTDVQMPRLDGVALVEHLRKTPGLEHVPVLMFTGKQPTSDIITVLGLDHVRYMSKGDPQRVIAALDEMLAPARVEAIG